MEIFDVIFVIGIIAFFLFKLDSRNCVVWDSWHLTADDAMNQAALEYSVPRQQWKAIDEPQS